MEAASFSGFIKTLIYIVFFYYVFKFISRLLFPILVKKAVNHAETRFREQAQSYQQQQSQYQNQYNSNQKKDGEITIDTSGAQPSREKKKVGEYVDFEELK